MVVFMFKAKIVTGGACGAFCDTTKDMFLGVSIIASNLHQDVGTLLAETFFTSSQHGPLIFLVNRNLSRVDWLAPKIRLKVFPCKLVGMA